MDVFLEFMFLIEAGGVPAPRIFVWTGTVDAFHLGVSQKFLTGEVAGLEKRGGLSRIFD
jgi:hypothetical protein